MIFYYFCTPVSKNRDKNNTDMAVTRLQRKDMRNKARANNRVKRIKQLTKMPVIKNVDIEEIKKSFASK